MSKLDDLLGKKKEIVPVLDLSKTITHTKEEYKRLLERVPDYKMRPIKVRTDEIKIKDKDWNFRPAKKETRYLLKHFGERDKAYQYLDPIPTEMRSIVLLELCPVPIDWKMLTTLRPKSNLEEDYYSKLIELGKLSLKTEARDKRELIINNSIRKTKNKSGIIETKVCACAECSEEFCNGRSCCDFNYDLYTRIIPKIITNKQTTSMGIINTKVETVAEPAPAPASALTKKSSSKINKNKNNNNLNKNKNIKDVSLVKNKQKQQQQQNKGNKIKRNVKFTKKSGSPNKKKSSTATNKSDLKTKNNDDKKS